MTKPKHVAKVPDVWQNNDVLPRKLWNNDNSVVTITYSNIEAGWPGKGNIGADPCFVEPGYWDPNGIPEDPNDDFWVDGDYHLKSEAGRWDANSESWYIGASTSPCIDAGDLEALEAVVKTKMEQLGQGLL